MVKFGSYLGKFQCYGLKLIMPSVSLIQWDSKPCKIKKWLDFVHHLLEEFVCTHLRYDYGLYIYGVCVSIHEQGVLVSMKFVVPIHIDEACCILSGNERVKINWCGNVFSKPGQKVGKYLIEPL